MLQTALALVLLAAAPSDIVPSGNPTTVPWGKKDSGYLFDDNKSLTLDVTGPTAVVLELRGNATLKGKKIALEIARNDAFTSKNSIAFKPTPGGPDKLRFMAKLGFKVADGPQHFVLTADTAGLALRAITAKAVPKPITAAAEQPLPGPGPGAAVAGKAPTPPAETAAPPPAAAVEAPAAPAPAPATTEEIAATTVATAHDANAMLMGADQKDAPKAAPEAGVATAALRVAVYDLELQGVDPRVGKVVTDSLLAEVRKLQGVAAIGMTEIRDMLSMEASKQMAGCESNESCLAEIAGALGVDDLVTGSLAKVGDGNMFVVRRVDQRQAKIRGTVNQRLKAGAGDEFLLAIGPAVQELFPERDLKAGKERGVAKEVALRINPPPLPKWTFYSAAGAALVAVAAGGVMEFLAQDKAKDYRATAARGVPTAANPNAEISGAELKAKADSATFRADTARYTFIGSGVFALAAGVMAFFTDWQGYGEVQPGGR
ncbi:MAG: hypothetical protein HY903_07590 [Deltaproteobacteria bacterium]|nr:hypothetical protein [Deltaproteobacteria bacterium]